MSENMRNSLVRRSCQYLAAGILTVAGLATLDDEPYNGRGSVIVENVEYGSGFGESAVASLGQTATLTTFNVHSGKNGEELVINEVNGLEADIVALQEATWTIADQIDYDFSSRAQTTWDKGVEFGLVIASSHPIVDEQTYRLPTRPNTESRKLQLVKIFISGYGIVCIANTHLTPDRLREENSEIRREQLKSLFTKTNDYCRGLPTAILGDLNQEGLELPEPYYDVLASVGLGDLYTHYGGYSNSRYDFILANNMQGVVRAGRLASDSSDHLPIFAELALVGGQ